MRNLCRPGSKLVAAFASGFFFACVATAGFAADQVTSEFTKTVKGVVLSQSKPGGEMEFSSIRYQGLGGYDVIVQSDDDRSWVDLQFGGKKVDLRYATFDLSPGGFPNKANDVVEWRGVRRKGEFVPFAIIYRLEGTDEQTRKPKSRLIVIHLDKLRSRVAGFAEGRNEDGDAKKIADRFRQP
jgi:hypothetical protein